MNKKYLILILFFLLYNYNILPQRDKTFICPVKIIKAQINLVETVTAYKTGNTRVYPPSKIPFKQNHYKCNFSIRLQENNSIIKGSFKFKCYLANGKVITIYLNPQYIVLYPNQIFDFTYDIKTEDNYFGRTEIELIKYNPNASSGKNNTEIICDKANIFIQ